MKEPDTQGAYRTQNTESGLNDYQLSAARESGEHLRSLPQWFQMEPGCQMGFKVHGSCCCPLASLLQALRPAFVDFTTVICF